MPPTTPDPARTCPQCLAVPTPIPRPPDPVPHSNGWGVAAGRRIFGKAAAGCLVLLGLATARGETLPSPQAHLGFRPGADYRLATWAQVVSYFQAVARGSDRVRLRTLGETTEGRPYLAAVVSSPETVRGLGRYRSLQRRLHDPRALRDDDDRRSAVADSKPVVVVTCSIHSSETASTLMAMELLHGLATGDDPATREALERTILILVPSANPDGVDKVARWYERSKGHPWEGSGMPVLYHKYAGHDTNRDWFMLNLKETKLLTHLLYKEWCPTLLYDVHQMGGRGARIFVPPFHDPINPNLDPRLSQGIFLIGAHMASDLAAAGKRGVLYGAQYDNWWNGGNRTTPQRHNVVAVLTEAASVRMASPVFLERDDLRAGARGFPDHRPAVNFVDPWPGGWWRLRDIVDYELVCARSLLTLAARYHESFQSNLLGMARDAVARGESEPPYAWVVPQDQRDPGTAAAMVRILHDSGIEVRRALEPFQADGVRFPAGAWVLPAAQPYRAHLKDLMERQVYPTRLTAGGRAEPPYDVSGWTLPLQMGVRAVPAASPLSVKVETLDRIEGPKGGIEKYEGQGKPSHFTIANTANDDFRVRNALVSAGVEVRVVAAGVELRVVRGSSPDDTRVETLKPETLIFPAVPEARSVLDAVLPEVSTRVLPVFEHAEVIRSANTARVPRRRVAVYQPWVPSMDEGWTRFVLESFKVSYTTVHNAEVRAGALHNFDVLLIPSIAAKTLRDGYAPNETEPTYVGGLGAEGVAELRRFVHEGGRLVCLDASCEFAIEALNLPVRDVLKGLPSSEFYGPGSVLRAEADKGHRLTRGMPETVYVYFDESRAFELKNQGAGMVALRYAASDALESGWLLGPSRLQGKAALVEVPFGRGTVVLFGFPPQHRGQTHGTFRLLFNALLD